MGPRGALWRLAFIPDLEKTLWSDINAAVEPPLDAQRKKSLILFSEMRLETRRSRRKQNLHRLRAR